MTSRRMVLLLLVPCLLNGCSSARQPRNWTFAYGAPVRGDVSKKQIALIFTGGEYGEGTPHILNALAERHLKASFFPTGDYLRQPEHRPHLQRMIADDHYVGPHSDSHPLYCPWEDRNQTLVTGSFFKSDLQKNIDDLRALGALQDRRQVVYFIPPFEWYNADQVRWARDMGVLLFNFTPGSGSNRDFAPEGHKSFVRSRHLRYPRLRAARPARSERFPSTASPRLPAQRHAAPAFRQVARRTADARLRVRDRR